MSNKSKSGHTQGPWKASLAVVCNAPSVFVITTGKWGAPNIAMVDSEANARLIASSPDMLSALLIVSEEMKHKTLCKEALLDLVNHVIAKAQGKEEI